MQRESTLTQLLLEQLQQGGIRKLTRLQNQAKFSRELGDNSFRADIFISLSKDAVSKRFVNRHTHFIAIEVKIKDWKQGLYQAWRYNAFAEKSYLALYKQYANGVDLKLFLQYNVGLIVFDEVSVEVFNTPKNNKFHEQTYSNQLRSKLWDKLTAMESIQPSL